VLGIMLLGTAAFNALNPIPFTPADMAKYIGAIPEDARKNMSFDELQSLVTAPIRSELFKIFALIGVGLACIGVALCCLNQIAQELVFRIGNRMSV
jgi:hypothetical protein